jgi:predicted nucleic acid-binding protein
MRLVVSGTSPIRYLVRIGQIDLLPRLFERILIPSVVADELRHSSAPTAVQAWINLSPAWAEVWPVASDR